MHQTTHPGCLLHDRWRASEIQGQGRPVACNLGTQPGAKPMNLGPVGLPILLVMLRTWERRGGCCMAHTSAELEPLIQIKAQPWLHMGVEGPRDAAMTFWDVICTLRLLTVPRLQLR